MATLEQAMRRCKVRGYIRREQWPPHVKVWKNHHDFDDTPDIVSGEDATAHDWDAFDDEGESTSIIG